MKFYATVIAAAATLAFFGAGCVRSSVSPETAAPSTVAQRAPSWSLKDYSGKTVSSVDFKGLPLVINSWASWCPYCQKELPDFATVQDENRGRVVFIAIDRSESREAAKEFTDRIGVTDKMVFLLDPADSFYQSIGGFAMPETIFVDREGVIRHHQRGPLSAPDTRAQVRPLVGPGDGMQPAPAGAGAAENEAAAVGVRINFIGSSFHPPSVRIKRGQTVTFVNESSQPVRITSSGFAPSAELGSEGNYTVTLSVAGVVTYSNALDPKSAGGEIVVE